MRVTGGLPETGRVFMVSLNKRRNPKASLRPQPRVRLLYRTFGDATAPEVRMNGQSVHVAAPPVERPNQRPNQPAILIRRKSLAE
jgi:hypothetical protein